VTSHPAQLGPGNLAWAAQRPLPRREPATGLATFLRWTPLELAFATALLTGVWRFQMFLPVIAKLQIPLLASGAAIGLFVMRGGSRDLSRAVRHPVSRWVIVILGLMLLSVPTSLYPGMSARAVSIDHARDIILMLLIAASLRSRASLERLALANLFGGVGFCLAVWKYAGIGADGRLGDLGYYDANDFAMMLVCSAPLAVYFLRRGVPMPVKAFAIATLGVFLYFFVKSGSRGGFLGLLAVSAFMLLRYTAFSKQARLATFITASVLLVTIAGNRYWEMMGTLLHPTQDYNWSGHDEGGRMEVWRRGIGYMLSRPLTGVGVNAFYIAEGTLSPLAERQSRGIGLKWSAAHNSFVQIGAELGVLGLVALVMALWRAAQTLRWLTKLPRGPGRRVLPEVALAQSLLASLVGFVVAGFFLSQAYSALLYVLLGMVVGLSTVAIRLVPVATPVTPSGIGRISGPRPPVR